MFLSFEMKKNQAAITEKVELATTFVKSRNCPRFRGLEKCKARVITARKFSILIEILQLKVIVSHQTVLRSYFLRLCGYCLVMHS